jgi:hypothetical protein
MRKWKPGVENESEEKRERRKGEKDWERRNQRVRKRKHGLESVSQEKREKDRVRRNERVRKWKPVLESGSNEKRERREREKEREKGEMR